jgi:hypothetical protein
MNKFKSMISAALMAVVLTTTTAIAEDSFYAGINTFYRDYKEDLALPHKSTEHGQLYGLTAGYKSIDFDEMFWEVEGGYAVGKTKYDGSLQNLRTGAWAGLHKDKTKNELFNVEGKIGYTFDMADSMVTPYIGVGYHSWMRDLSKDGMGFKEKYTRPYLSAGINFSTGDWFDEWEIGVGVKAMAMTKGKMKINDFPARLKLGNKVNLEVELPITYRPDDGVFGVEAIKVVPYFQKASIGKSNTLVAPVAGGGTIGVYEPASKASVVGVKFVVEF